MDLLDLKIFRQLYIQRNISAVSRLLYLSQPTISYRLNKLQQELNIKLYDYDGDYHFTGQSRIFYEYCCRILNQYEEMLSRLDARDSFQVNLSTVATHLYLDPIYSVLEEKGLYPMVHSCRSDEAIRNILEGQADMAIVGGSKIELPRHVDVVPLKDERIVLVYNRQFKDDISEIPIIIDQKDSGIHAAVLDYLDQFDDVKIVGEIGTTADRLTLINNRPLGMFINETYIRNFEERYPGICVSETYQIHRNILLLADKSSRYRDIIEVLIKKLNKTPLSH